MSVLHFDTYSEAIGTKKGNYSTVAREEKNNNAMPRSYRSYIDLDDDEEEEDMIDELAVRRSTSYSISKTPTSGVDQAVACALKSHPKVFQYTQKHIKSIPPSIGHLSICANLRELDFSGNELQSLPDEIQQLVSVVTCNLGRTSSDELISRIPISSPHLGHNHFSDIPAILGSLPRLHKLMLYHNRFTDLSQSETFGKLTNIRILNLNYNAITRLPTSIGQLVHLEVLSLEHNQLTELPREIGSCRKLTELYLGYNQLAKLPLEVGFLTELKRLVVHRNQLLEIPESVTNLKSCLKHLDVSCNYLRIFPSKFHTLHLKEFFAEGNPLLQRAPIHSIQESEILTLKEICARRAMAELRHPTMNLQPSLRDRLQHFKRAKEILMLCTECQYCHNYFLNTWLECVEFLDVNRAFKGAKSTGKQTVTLVPQRVLLCSYECFNSPGHNYFGVAFG